MWLLSTAIYLICAVLNDPCATLGHGSTICDAKKGAKSSKMLQKAKGPEPTLSQYSHHFLLVSSDRQNKTTIADASSSFGGPDLRPTSISSLASAPLISCSGHHVVTAAEPCDSSSASCSIPTDPRSTYEAGRCLALSILFCIWTPSWIHLFCRPFRSTIRAASCCLAVINRPSSAGHSTLSQYRVPRTTHNHRDTPLKEWTEL